MIDIKIICRNEIERNYGMELFNDAIGIVCRPSTSRDLIDKNAYHLRIGTHTKDDLEFDINFDDLR